MARCVYTATFDGTVYRTACCVHSNTGGPCPNNGQPARDGLMHTFGTYDWAVVQWQEIGGGQRPMVVHHDTIPNDQHVYASRLPTECPCGAEVIEAASPEIGA